MNNSPCAQPAQQAAAIAQLSAMVQGRQQLIGPDSGYNKWQAWLTALLTPATAGLLHAVTHHVYNGVSRKTWDSPMQLDSSLPEIAWYRATVTAQAPGAQAWAGEDGPIGGGTTARAARTACAAPSPPPSGTRTT